MKRPIRFVGTKILAYSAATLLALLCLLPTLLAIVNATRSTGDILKGISFVPGSYFMQNVRTISRADLGVNIWRALMNSLIVSSSTTLLAMYVSALTAYAIKAYPCARLNKFFYGAVLAIMLLPAQLNIVGFFKYMAQLKLLNNYLPLILPGIAAPTTVFFIKKYLDSVMQISLVEASRIDGAGEFYLFNCIMLPIMAPAVATMGLEWDSSAVGTIF